METYEVTVYYSEELMSGTLNNIYIELIGKEGTSGTNWLPGIKYYLGMGSQYTITSKNSIGKLLLIKIHKKPLVYYQDSWFPKKIEVKAPDGKLYIFPMCTWITDDQIHYFNEGQALKDLEDCPPRSQEIRSEELQKRQKAYSWKESEKGIPEHVEAKSESQLPLDAQFILSKSMMFKLKAALGKVWADGWTKFSRMFNADQWTNFDQLNKLVDYSSYKILDKVKENWRKDEFFGYQFLNGLNPMLIKCIKALPDNFHVTDDMISHYCNGNLDDEIKKGNIFLCDYKLLDGVQTEEINKKKQYLAAPLVLLYKTPEDTLVPIAIQLKQKPAADNPIFLPNDSQYDWLLAKIFVRSAEFHLHQLNFHLLRTHLLAEVFAVSLLRNLPMVHPLYKLLIAHTHYTLGVNVLARNNLINSTGAFTQISASGEKGTLQILKRSLSSLTYKSLCIHDDIKERGMENIPNFYYRDDGCRLWDILHSFVEGILKHYYKNDNDVKRDAEVQEWIREINHRGFMGQEKSGIPQRFNTVSELVKFVTMVIFTGSVQHSAVNSGQYDFGGWMPNLPTTMKCPPPTEKGKATEDTLIAALPDKSTTYKANATLYLLTREYSDFVKLGDYPEEHFTEEKPRELIKKFQDDLKKLSKKIKKRNNKLDLPYEYLDPEKVENSVTI
ncbi:polyunsaturated fatty acid lipoxygenase ALOX15B-like [Fundulus heteroclitus]|uniref:polyunsaturated fatty acid lipoxygenase ALOX15B-like n=1 Tax=Fundulus heteroclitus TaxID=8078 RepID=UPI00165B99EA|nr:polyunsaturated fatty acid lipoxygenase ALOX15B-like [Fundulus heteroclitus]